MSPVNKALARWHNAVFLRRTGNVHSITIPSYFLKQLDWQEKQILLLEVKDDKTLIVKEVKLEVA